MRNREKGKEKGRIVEKRLIRWCEGTKNGIGKKTEKLYLKSFNYAFFYMWNSVWGHRRFKTVTNFRFLSLLVQTNGTVQVSHLGYWVPRSTCPRSDNPKTTNSYILRLISLEPDSYRINETN